MLLGRLKDWTWAQLDSVVGSIGGALEGNPKLGNLDSPTCHFASFMAGAIFMISSQSFVWEVLVTMTAARGAKQYFAGILCMVAFVSIMSGITLSLARDVTGYIDLLAGSASTSF